MICLLRALIGSLLLTMTCSLSAAELMSHRVVGQKDFDRSNFTQGLTIHEGKLWVSSGLYGQSKVSRYDWPSMKLERSKRLPSRFFAEGLSFVDGNLLLLTWRSKVILELNPDTLETLRFYPIKTEGWGITSHDGVIWVSDGSHRLWSGIVGEPLKPIEVTINGRAIDRLNELEWINGEIWANRWQTDQILRINPTTGVINSIVDLSGLLPPDLRRYDTDVLNGIAHDSNTNQLWVTGKRWPRLFNIEPIK